MRPGGITVLRGLAPAWTGCVASTLLSVCLVAADEPGWLTATSDADYTDRFIQEKLGEIEPGVTAALEFVRDDIAFEAYRGSLRGARGSLWSGAGNSLDQASLLIALLRGQGIEARYARGRLFSQDRRELLASMFDPVLMAQAIGHVPDDHVKVDPISDAELHDAVRDHWWVELQDGTALDPCFANASVGDSRTPVLEQHFEIPDALRHKVTVRLVTEFHTTLTRYSESTPLEATFSTAEIYGKPITLGHFVRQQTQSGFFLGVKTYTYSPYLVIDDNDNELGNDRIIRGNDYQEFFSSVALANVTLTRVTLEMEVLSPEGEPERFSRDLLDRVGIAARAGVGGPQAVLAGDTAFESYPKLTLQVVSGFVDPDVVEPQIDAYQALGARSDAVFDTLDAVADGLTGGTREEQSDAVDQAEAFVGEESIWFTRMVTSLYLMNADKFTRLIDRSDLVRLYHARPRLILASDSLTSEADGSLKGRTALDLRSDPVHAVPYPGQNLNAAAMARGERSAHLTFLEGDILKELTGGDAEGHYNESALDVFFAAANEGTSTRLLFGARQTRELEELNLSPEAEARITEALDQGRSVTVPERMVTLNGRETVAWFEGDPEEGRFIGVLEDGGHQATTEYALLRYRADMERQAVRLEAQGLRGSANWIRSRMRINGTDRAIIDSLKNQRTTRMLGRLRNPNTGELERDMMKMLQKLVNEQRRNMPARQFRKEMKQLIWALVNTGYGQGQHYPLFDPPGADVVWRDTDYRVIRLFADDRFSANDGTPLIETNSATLAMTVVPDPSFSVRGRAYRLPSAFRVRTVNAGDADDLVISATTPTNWTALVSRVTNPVPSSVTGVVSVLLEPDQGSALPPPGSRLPFAVTVRPQASPADAVTAEAEFSVPEVHGLAFEAMPEELFTTPNGSVNTRLTFVNTGNATELVTVAVSCPAGFSASGTVSPFALTPGSTATQTLSLASQDVATGTEKNATVSVTYGAGGSNETHVVLRLSVAAPGAMEALHASTSAGLLGREELAGTLESLGRDASALYADPTREQHKARLLASSVALTAQLDDPLLREFEPSITAAASVVRTSTVTAVEAALTEMAGALAPLGERLTLMASHDVEVSLSPNSADALPETPTRYGIALKNLGTEETSYDLRLDGVPVGITAVLSHDRITLPAGYGIAPGSYGTYLLPIDVTATLTQPARELAAFEFDLVVTAVGATQIVRRARGMFTAREELVAVLSVECDPPFTDPGGWVEVRAGLLNAVNRDREAGVRYTVRDAQGGEVFASDLTPVSLTVLSSVDTVSPGWLDTRDLALGVYYIEVVVYDETGAPIPGATGTGSLLVGTPVTGSMSSFPPILLPGNGVVTSRVEISTSVYETEQDLIRLRGLRDTPGTASAVSLDGDYAYVGPDVAVIDIRDPDAPSIVRIVTNDVAEATALDTVSNMLVASVQPAGVELYSLTNPAAPLWVGRQEAPEAYAGNGVHSAFVRGKYAFLDTFVMEWDFWGGVHWVRGDLLAFDVGDPSNPSYLRPLYGTHGAPYGGGDYYIGGGDAVNAEVALIPSSTEPGAAQDGQGNVLVVDIRDPAVGLPVLGSITVADTKILNSISVQGSRALAVGTTDGFGMSGGEPTLEGQLTLTALDVSDPEHPVAGPTRVTEFPSATQARARPAGGDQFFVSGVESNGTWQIMLVSIADPGNIVVRTLAAPTITLDGRVRDGLLCTASDSGLGLYSISNLVTPVTADVTIGVPNMDDIAVVASSHTLPPDEVRSQEGWDELVWHVALPWGRTAQSWQWETAVTDLQPGEVRDTAVTGSVDYAAMGGTGRQTLPRTAVTCEHMLSLIPGDRIVAPGASTSFDVMVKNPSGTPRTFRLDVRGVPSNWVTLASSVNVAAGAEVGAPLVLSPESCAAYDRYGLTVQASSSNGVRGSVQGVLYVDGERMVPDRARGVDIALAPAEATAGPGTEAQYAVRLTNTGSEREYYTLSVDTPAGMTSHLAAVTQEVPPGLFNAREVLLTLAVEPGTPTGRVAFAVTAECDEDAAVRGSVTGAVNVAPMGVALEFTPGSVAPDGTLELSVTNVGQVTQTFDLTLGGPAGVAASLGTNRVTLTPDAGARIPVEVADIGFALPGSLALHAVATARDDTNVQGIATATVDIPPQHGVVASCRPTVRAVPVPGTNAFWILVTNTGNEDEGFSATVSGTSGPVTAALRGLDGSPTNRIEHFRLPAQAVGTVVLEAGLQGEEKGTVTVTVQSRETPESSATSTAVVVPPVTLFIEKATNTAEITFEPLEGADHTVQVRDRLSSGGWSNYPGGPHNVGRLIDAESDKIPQRFYRLVITVPVP